MTVILITGTGTDIGKTIVTAGMAAAATARMVNVCVVKPVQTGVLPGEHGDAAEVARLSGVLAVHEFTRLEDPLAPETAARLRGVAIPKVDDYVEKIIGLDAEHDMVMVEGAGGLLVRLDAHEGTIATIGQQLTERGVDLVVLLVTTLTLGTLNQTQLTVEALGARGLDCAGLIIGSSPQLPDLAERCNRDDLTRVTGVPVIGTVPAAAGRLEPTAFQQQAITWFD